MLKTVFQFESPPRVPTTSGRSNVRIELVKPTDLRGILRYIPRFREKTFVIALDGVIVTDDMFQNLLLDIAVLRSLNIRIVLVHGASHQIAQLAAERGVTA